MRLITLLFTLFFITLAHSGKVYQWTDESGQTHFSQFPPNQGQAEHVDVNAPSSKNTAAANERLKAMRQNLQEQAVDRTTQAEEDKLAAAEAEKLAKACSRAKGRLIGLKDNGRIYRVLENGEREWYDEKGRDKLIKDAQNDVDKLCSQ